MTTDSELIRSRRLVEEFIIPKCSSKAFLLKKGQVLRVIAHEGKQVADIRFINAHDFREQFSASLSISLNTIEGIGGREKIKKLYSNPPWQNVMLTVIDDKVGKHLPGTQCTPMHYELMGLKGHLNCADLFDKCLAPYNLSLRDLDSTGVFNVFMPISYLDDENGTVVYQRPSCEKGDYIDFLAEIDVLVAATSCPNDSIVNDYKCKGMQYRIFE
jgi:uncharacterized protein YcgI (DUF1989 family)